MDEGGSGNGTSLSEEAPWRGPGGGAPSLETLESMLRKSPDAGISVYRGPFITEGNLVSGRNFERWAKEGSRNRVSLCKGFHEGDLVEKSLYWGPCKIC